jgi:twitching motility protein PilI
MSEAIDLRTLLNQPFELLTEIERRSRKVHTGHGGADAPDEWVGVGFRIGDERFVASRDSVREVLILPDSMTRVPGAKRWLLGIANLRGHLLPLVDVKLLLGSGRTSLRRTPSPASPWPRCRDRDWR